MADIRINMNFDNNSSKRSHLISNISETATKQNLIDFKESFGALTKNIVEKMTKTMTEQIDQ